MDICFVPNFKGKAFSPSRLGKMLAKEFGVYVVLFYLILLYAFYHVEGDLFYS